MENAYLCIGILEIPGFHLCGIGLDGFAAVARGGGFWRVTLLFAWVGERKTVGYGLVFKERKGSR